MTTVTAKSLRNNLSKYLDRLEKGEEIVIIRHSEIIGTLRPVSDARIANGTIIAAMLERNKSTFAANKNLTSKETPTKELYREALADKYNP